MRRSVRAPVAQMQAQEKLLRKQLFIAIGILSAIVGICFLNFKTYDPGRKLVHVNEKPTKNAIESLKTENEEMQKTINKLKRDLASEKKKALEVKQVEEAIEVQSASDSSEVSTAAVETK